MKRCLYLLIAALAICLAGAAPALDADVEALRARLAEQERLLRQALDNSEMLRSQVAQQAASLHDINAKMAAARNDGDHNAPAAILSLRKNAAVTIGGILGPRYSYRDAKLDSSLVLDKRGGTPVYTRRGDGRRVRAEDHKYGDLRVKDAKFDVKIDVNDHLDAFIRLDLQDTNAPRSHVSGIAQNYWLRWKNIGNSGFGVLIGRDILKYGDNQPIGLIAGWNKSMNDTSTVDYTAGSRYRDHDGTKGNGMFAYDSLIPAHTTYDWQRTTQINPYWESPDGALRVDATLIQSIDRLTGLTGAQAFPYDAGDHTEYEYRSLNYGLGSAALRVVWKPLEGLKLTAGAMNLYAQNRQGFIWGPEARRSGGDYGVDANNHNSSVNLAFQYRPAAFQRLNVWAQWTHGWNEAWVDDMDSDSLNVGVTFDATGRLTLFAQGDYLRVRNRQSELWNKATGWAFYGGFVYKASCGVLFESGWRHEEIGYKDRAGAKHSKLTGDTVYTQASLLF